MLEFSKIMKYERHALVQFDIPLLRKMHLYFIQNMLFLVYFMWNRLFHESKLNEKSSKLNSDISLFFMD